MIKAPVMIENHLDNVGRAGELELEPADRSSSALTSRLSTSSISTLTQSQLKILMRSVSFALQDSIRKSLWVDLALRVSRSGGSEDYDSQYDSLTVNKLPKFVDACNARFFHLNSDGQRHVATILWNINQCNYSICCVPCLFILLMIHCSLPSHNVLTAPLSTGLTIFAFSHAKRCVPQYRCFGNVWLAGYNRLNHAFLHSFPLGTFVSSA